MSIAMTADRETCIEQDLACLNCEYNLRTLPTNAACPECGLAVTVSLRRDGLQSTPPAYRHRLQRGAGLLVAGVALAFPLLYPGLVVAAVGLLLLLGREPGRDEPAKDRAWRVLARTGVGLGTISVMGVGAAVLLSVVSGHRPIVDDWLNYDTAFVIAHAVLGVGLLAAWRHLEHLSLRMTREVEDRPAMRQLQRDWIEAVVALAVIGGGVNLWPILGLEGAMHGLLGPALAGLALAVVLTWLWWRTLTAARGLRAMLAGLGGSDGTRRSRVASSEGDVTPAG